MKDALDSPRKTEFKEEYMVADGLDPLTIMLIKEELQNGLTDQVNKAASFRFQTHGWDTSPA